jgi:hypothetical protein
LNPSDLSNGSDIDLHIIFRDKLRPEDHQQIWAL